MLEQLASRLPLGLQDLVIVVGVLALVAVFAVQVLVRQAFSVALYRYATTGESQGPFTEHDLQSPFGRKRRR